MTLPRIHLRAGSCIDLLRELPEQCIQTCVTSPPYFGLRNYNGGDAEIGKEETPAEFVASLVAVFREVRRVLKDDGTVWLNLGDTYANTNRGHNSNGLGKLNGSNLKNKAGYAPNRSTPLPPGLEAKDLIGIPWRVAFALQDDGWILRQDIIWHKPNPMPESVRDRCTKAHEYIFLLAKKPKYYFDSSAMQEPAVYANCGRPSKKKGDFNGKTEEMADTGRNAFRAVTETRNKRSVWTVSSKPFKGAHFATFPPDLIEPCILAGSRPGDRVLDPCLGSGTTGLVAVKHGRSITGFDLNPEYLAMASDRIYKPIIGDFEV